MAKHHGPVLVDTNTIIECWRVSAWKALTGGYAVETVEKCVEETQTGFQRRRPEERIDLQALRAYLRRIHPVSDAELAGALVRDALIPTLDDGERHLWAHALGRPDTWVLCGPDGASLRVGLRLGLRARLVSLERLLGDAGFKSAGLRINHTQKWLDAKLADLWALESRARL